MEFAGNQFTNDFPDVGGKRFEWVYTNRSEFADFTIYEMGSPTGKLAKWKAYCLARNKKTNG